MPKNIILITTDQHRWDYLGAMGQPILQGLTPNLDRLVEEGALFEHCYSPNPLCMPARHAMQSGLYSFQSGQMDNVGDWPLDFPTFPQILRRHGYRTCLTGKLHAHEAVGYDIDLTAKVWDDEIHALGFDDVTQVSGKSMAFFTEDAYTHHLADHGLLYAYREDIVNRQEAGRVGVPTAWPSILPEEHYVDNFIGQRAVDWLSTYDGEAPFLHVISFCSPHPPFDAPQSALDIVSPELAVLPDRTTDPEYLRAAIVNYAAQIHVVDRNIGRILDVLDARGWLDEALILFTADHGEMLGDGGRWGKCGWQDGSIRVPLIVRCPGWTQGRRVTETMAACHDIATTILDFAMGGDSAPQTLPGSDAISLKPYLTGAASEARSVIYSENGGQFGRPWRLVDDGDYRYVWLLDTGEELLFDRANDPHCLDDAAAGGADSPALDRLRREMLRIHITHPSPKTGRAAYSPATPHRVTRERLARTRKPDKAPDKDDQA